MKTIKQVKAELFEAQLQVYVTLVITFENRIYFPKDVFRVIPTINIDYKILGSYSSVCGHSNLVGFDAISISKWLPTFRRKQLYPYSVYVVQVCYITYALNMEAAGSSETSVTISQHGIMCHKTPSSQTSS
jgi:hypothetical protein